MTSKSKTDPNQRNHRNKRILVTAVVLLVASFCVVSFLEYRLDQDLRWQPDEPKIDLAVYLQQQSLFSSQTPPALSEQAYEVLLKQTGLGKPSVDLLLQKGQKTAIETLEEYQELFYSKPKILCRKIGPITSEERLINEEEKAVAGNPILYLEDGDVLITKATHSIGWRHGHAALVVDAEKRITLEAAVWGENTAYQDVRKWESYPTLIQLRYRKNPDVSEQAVTFAKQQLNNIPYGLLTGMVQKTKIVDKVTKTQCAHLVWYPYLTQGLDLDSDGGWLVTPNDLTNSVLFEVVQVYGADPEELWP